MNNAKVAGGRRLKKTRPGLTLDSDCVQDNVPVKIIDGIYIGSVHCAFNKDSLAKYGITHILNISGVPATYPKNFTYLQVTMRDKEYANLLSAIPAANIFIESCIDSGGNVLVHCKGGRSRSAAFVCAFLMSTMGLSFEEAFQIVKCKRSVVNCNKGFESQLAAYGLSGWDVYHAHQMLLREHLQALLHNFKLNRSVSTRQLASCAVNTPVKLCLTRPKGNTKEQVIPPLRGADMKFVCRRCSTPLFVTCSIVNILPLDSTESKVSSLVLERRLNLKNTVQTAGNAHEDNGSVSTKAPAASIDQDASSKTAETEFGEEYVKLAERPPRLRRYYASATIAEPFGEKESMDDDVEMEMESIGSLPMSEPRRRRRSASDSSSNEEGDAMNVDNDDFLAGRKVVEVNEGGKFEEEHNSLASSRENAFNNETPLVRPQLKERERWLAQMKALECDVERPKDRRHRPSLIARFDEQRASLISESKHYFIEPMEWMGELSNLSGPICCANELCKLQVGRYDWGGLPLEQKQCGGRSSSSFGECAASKSNVENSEAGGGTTDDRNNLFIAPAFRIEAGLVLPSRMTDKC